MQSLTLNDIDGRQLLVAVVHPILGSRDHCPLTYLRNLSSYMSGQHSELYELYHCIIQNTKIRKKSIRTEMTKVCFCGVPGFWCWYAFVWRIFKRRNGTSH